jgi:multiple sugar transport system permease protein
MTSAIRPTTRPRRQRPQLLFYAVCTVLFVLFAFPLFWSVLTSLKPPSEASASPPTFLPSRLTLENYANLASYGDGIGRYLFNSVSVTLMTVVGAVLLSTLGGYGFSRFNFPAKNLVFIVILVTLMIPFQSILTPLFLLLRFIHLQNTLLGLALVYITFQLPFAVFMMRNSFDSVPRELEEAALIDGCTPITLLTKVMLPVVLPGIVTVALFAFFGAWNEFLAALIFMSNAEDFTLPVMLLNAQAGQFGTVNWGAMQAGLTISMLPCAVLFLLLQRYYINGLIAGAVKG